MKSMHTASRVRAGSTEQMSSLQSAGSMPLARRRSSTMCPIRPYPEMTIFITYKVKKLSSHLQNQRRAIIGAELPVRTGCCFRWLFTLLRTVAVLEALSCKKTRKKWLKFLHSIATERHQKAIGVKTRREQQMIAATVYQLKILRSSHQSIITTKSPYDRYELLLNVYNLGSLVFNNSARIRNSTIGTNTTKTAFCLNASPIFRFNRRWIALCVPQPGHFSPVSRLKGHLGNGAVAGLTFLYNTIIKKTAIADVTIIAAFFVNGFILMSSLQNQIHSERTPVAKRIIAIITSIIPIMMLIVIHVWAALFLASDW